MTVVLKDFWATWCGPCRVQKPIVEEIEEEYEGKIEVQKIDVDSDPEAASEHNVMSIPTIILQKDGETIEQWVGVTQKETLTAAIDKALE